MKRRSFIRNTGFAAMAMGIKPMSFAGINNPAKNKLPKWKGFNLN